MATDTRRDARDVLVDSPHVRRAVRALFGFRGGRAVGHAVRTRLYRDRLVVIDDFAGNLRFGCRLDEHMGSQIYWRGVYSWAQLELLGQMLRSDMVFVDAGANQGEFSVFAAARLPRGRVIAFEPVTALRERLASNVSLNGLDNVEIRSEALWSSRTNQHLHQPRTAYRDGSVNEGLGSLYAGVDDGPGEPVQCAPLDEIVQELGLTRVDIVKIDVEGAEAEVLRGASQVIDRFRPVLFVEADRDSADQAGVDLGALLDDLAARYTIEVIQRDATTVPLRRDRMRAHEDLLCVPR